jgi:hypothetical protein
MDISFQTVVLTILDDLVVDRDQDLLGTFDQVKAFPPVMAGRYSGTGRKQIGGSQLMDGGLREPTTQDPLNKDVDGSTQNCHRYKKLPFLGLIVASSLSSTTTKTLLIQGTTLLTVKPV